MSTADQIVAQSLAGQRFTALLMFVFAALGTLLAAVGLYGVLTHTVSQRIREIGLRMALGASRRMVLGQGMKVALFGIGIGLAGSLALTRLLANHLRAGRRFVRARRPSGVLSACAAGNQSRFNALVEVRLMTPLLIEAG